MTRGSISKLVTSYGTRWGRIQPAGESREIFFNSAALDKTIDFLSLVVGQVVEFQERKDQVNGTRAEHVLLVPGFPVLPHDARILPPRAPLLATVQGRWRHASSSRRKPAAVAARNP